MAQEAVQSRGQARQRPPQVGQDHGSVVRPPLGGRAPAARRTGRRPLGGRAVDRTADGLQPHGGRTVDRTADGETYPPRPKPPPKPREYNPPDGVWRSGHHPDENLSAPRVLFDLPGFDPLESSTWPDDEDVAMYVKYGEMGLRP